MAKTCLKRRFSDDKAVSDGWGRASGILVAAAWAFGGQSSEGLKN